MIRLFVIFTLLTCAFLKTKAQVVLNTDTAGLSTVSDNIYNRLVAGDSLVSSFMITIKKEVRPHKHNTHSEHVLVVDGVAEMLLGDKRFMIKKGDLIFIPKGTIHSVKNSGTPPLRVLSIQAPMFDGKDRVMIDK